MDGFLVERYWPGVTDRDVRHQCEQLTRACGPDVQLLGCALVPDDELVLFGFLAADRGRLEHASRRAGLRCDRILSAVYLWPAPGTAEQRAARAT